MSKDSLFLKLSPHIKPKFDSEIKKNVEELCISYEEKKYLTFKQKAGNIYNQLHPPKTTKKPPNSSQELKSEIKTPLPKTEVAIWDASLLYILDNFFAEIVNVKPAENKDIPPERITFLGSMLFNLTQLVYGQESYRWWWQHLQLNDLYFKLYPENSKIKEKRKIFLNSAANSLMQKMKDSSGYLLKYSDLLVRIVYRLFELHEKNITTKKELFDKFADVLKCYPNLTYHALVDAGRELTRQLNIYLEEIGQPIVHETANNLRSYASLEKASEELWHFHQMFSEASPTTLTDDIETALLKWTQERQYTREYEHFSERKELEKKARSLFYDIAKPTTRALRKIQVIATFLHFYFCTPVIITPEKLSLWLLPIINELWLEINAIKDWGPSILNLLCVLSFVAIKVPQKTLTDTYVLQCHRQFDALTKANSASFDKVLMQIAQPSLCADYIALQDVLLAFFKTVPSYLLPESVNACKKDSASRAITIFDAFVASLKTSYTTTPAQQNLSDIILVLSAVITHLNPTTHKQETSKFLGSLNKLEAFILNKQLPLLIDFTKHPIFLKELETCLDLSKSKPTLHKPLGTLLVRCSQPPQTSQSTPKPHKIVAEKKPSPTPPNLNEEKTNKKKKKKKQNKSKKTEATSRTISDSKNDLEMAKKILPNPLSSEPTKTTNPLPGSVTSSSITSQVSIVQEKPTGANLLPELPIVNPAAIAPKPESFNSLTTTNSSELKIIITPPMEVLTTKETPPPSATAQNNSETTNPSPLPLILIPLPSTTELASADRREDSAVPVVASVQHLEHKLYDKEEKPYDKLEEPSVTVQNPLTTHPLPEQKILSQPQTTPTNQKTEIKDNPKDGLSRWQRKRARKQAKKKVTFAEGTQKKESPQTNQTQQQNQDPSFNPPQYRILKREAGKSPTIPPETSPTPGITHSKNTSKPILGTDNKGMPTSIKIGTNSQTFLAGPPTQKEKKEKPSTEEQLFEENRVLQRENLKLQQEQQKLEKEKKEKSTQLKKLRGTVKNLQKKNR